MNKDIDIVERPPEDPRSTKHLEEYLEVCRQRRWVILCLAVTVSSLVAIWSFSQNPIYQAQTELRIEPLHPKVLQTGEAEEWETDRFDVEMQTHIKLLISHPVLTATARRLNLSEQQEYQPKPSLVKKLISLLISPIPTSLKEDIKTRALDFKKWIQDLVGGSSTNMSLQSDHKLLDKSPLNIEQNLVKRFGKKILIDYIKGSKLVLITIESEDPVFAARAANMLATVYAEEMIKKESMTTESTSQWFATQLDNLRNKVEESERALYAYRLANNLVDVKDQEVIATGGSSMATHRLEEQNRALVQAEIMRTAAQARNDVIQAIQAKLNSESNGQAIEQADLVYLTDVLKIGVIQDLRKKEVDLSVEMARLSEIYGPLHPKMINAQNQVNEIRTKISQEIDRIYRATKNDYEIALENEKSVQEEVTKQKTNKLKLDKHAVQYGILEREANSNRQLYDLFLQQMREANISAQIKTSNIYQAEPAIPNPEPVRPRTLLNTLLSLVAGLVSGVGLAFFLDYWDRSLKGPKDVERHLTGEIFLGCIPSLSGYTSRMLARLMESEPLSPASECYRHIRTSVRLAVPDHQPISLVITSPGEQEGKTTLAVNLAIAMSQLEDSRVVLIDTDLRGPCIDKIFDLEQTQDKSKGLMHYLVGDAEVSEIFHKTDLPNLVVVPSGGQHLNATELIHSTQLVTLLEWCREHRLHVIIDAPPVLAFADSLVMASQVYGTILVVSAGKTNPEAAQIALQQLAGHGAQFLAVVMQNVPQERMGYYYGASRYYASPIPHGGRLKFLPSFLANK